MIQNNVQRDIETLVIAGVIAGTVDIGAACLINDVGPVIVSQAIAAGLLGSRSFSLGAFSGVLGLTLQWTMSCLIAGIYVGMARRFRILKRRWIVAGLLYGVIVFGVMNYIVMPLSAIAKSPAFTTTSLVENILAMVLFGLIVSYIDQRRSPARRTD